MKFVVKNGDGRYLAGESPDKFHLVSPDWVEDVQQAQVFTATLKPGYVATISIEPTLPDSLKGDPGDYALVPLKLAEL